jgi:hypothetical protein
LRVVIVSSCLKTTMKEELMGAGGEVLVTIKILNMGK